MTLIANDNLVLEHLPIEGVAGCVTDACCITLFVRGVFALPRRYVGGTCYRRGFVRWMPGASTSVAEGVPDMLNTNTHQSKCGSDVICDHPLRDGWRSFLTAHGSLLDIHTWRLSPRSVASRTKGANQLLVSALLAEPCG